MGVLLCISLELVLEDTYDVCYTLDPGEALSHAATARPELIFLDVNMPSMNGLDVLQKLNQMDEIHSVIMISANDNVEFAVEAMKNGAYDYLVKPWTVEDVIIRSTKALEKRQLVMQNRYYRRHLEEEVEKKSRDLVVANNLLKKANLETIKVLTEAIEAKDRYTQGHCGRVSRYSRALAEGVGMSQDDLEVMVFGALLHDIGKLGLRESVLNKRGPLTRGERQEVEAHCAIGEKIIRDVDYLLPAAAIIRHHHERWDGRGYPDGKEGQSIPLMARIACVADVYDALTSERPYRPAKTLDQALEIMKQNRGIQFDPAILDLFLDQVDRSETIPRALPSLPQYAFGHLSLSLSD